MKKNRLLFLVFLVLSNFSASAQNLNFGINGGFLKNTMIIYDNTPRLNNWLPPERVPLNTFNWGVNLSYLLSDHWSVETQLQSVNITYKQRLDIAYHPHNFPGGWLFGEIDWYSNYHYIRVPMLAQYNFLSSQSILGISLLTGPNFGFQTEQTSNYVGVDDFGREMQNTISYQEIPFKKFDFGVQLGIRIHSKLFNKFIIFVDATTYQGLAGIIEYSPWGYNKPMSYYDDMFIVNRHSTINLGVKTSFNGNRRFF